MPYHSICHPLPKTSPGLVLGLRRSRGGNMRVKVWHWLYCHWYDLRADGRTRTAEVFGHLADAVCP